MLLRSLAVTTTARFRSLLTLAVAALALLAMAGAPGTAMAACPTSGTGTLPGSCFEGGDGNMLENTPGQQDWNSLTFAPLAVNYDAASSSSSAVWGGGVKQFEPQSWFWQAGTVNDKTNILSAASIARALGDVFLYFGFQSQEASGNANFAIELNQNKPEYTSTAVLTDPLTQRRTGLPKRKAGDLLISYDVTNSGVKVGACKWHGTEAIGEWKHADDDTSIGASEKTCHPLNGTTAQGAVNGATIDRPSNMSNTFAFPIPKDGFGEAAVNITKALNLTSSTCFAFGSIWMHSRTSLELSSQPKDLIAPVDLSLGSCAIDILKKQQLNATAATGYQTTPLTAHAGDTINYLLEVRNAGTQPIANPMVQDSRCAALTGPAFASGDTDSDLEINELWTYTCSHDVSENDALAGTYGNTASASGTINGYSFSDTSSVSANVTWADASVTKLEKLSTETTYVPGPIDFTVGNTVDYQVQVVTSGTEAQTVTLDDENCTLVSSDGLGDSNAAARYFTFAAAAGAATYTFTCSKQMTSAASFTNSVSISSTATKSDGTSISGTSSVTANPLVVTADVVKTQKVRTATTAPTHDDITFHVGDWIDYTITVNTTGNTGQTITLADSLCELSSTVTDLNGAAAGYVFAAASGNQSYSFTCAVRATSTADIANSVTLDSTGRDASGALVHDSDSVLATGLWSTASITKTQEVAGAAGDPVSTPITFHAGDTIDYTITVTTSGNEAQEITLADPVCMPAIADSNTAKAGVQFDAAIGGGPYVFTCSKTNMPYASIINRVDISSTGIDQAGLPVNGFATVSASPLWSTATVTKRERIQRTTPDAYVPGPIDFHTGDTIEYEITLETDGTETQDIVLTDSLTGCSLSPSGTFTTATGPQTYRFYCSVTAGNTPVITNGVSFTSTGIDQDGDDVSGSDSVVANQLWTTASVAKSQSLDTYHTGDVIGYEVTVTTGGNTTQTITLDDATCPDLDHDTIGDASAAAGFQFNATDGGTYVFTCSKTATNVPSITNEVTLTSTGRDTTGSSYTNTASVTANQLWTTATVAKQQSRTTYHTGDQITYGVTVTTDGNTTQRITLTDAVCPVEHATLQDADDDVAGFQFDTTVADTSYSFTCSLTAGNFPAITNAVTLTSDGRNKLGSTYTNTDSVTATQLWTTASVAKSQSRDTYHTGDQINYGVTVTTDGNTTQRITLVDPVCPVQHATLSDADHGTAGFQFDTSVAVKSYAFTCSLTAPNQSSITNVVTLTSNGRDKLGSTYTNTDSVTANQLWSTASVAKTQSRDTYHTGDQIAYGVTVTTGGNTTQRITLDDVVCPVRHATLQDADGTAAGFQFDATAAVTSYSFSCTLTTTNTPSITNEVILTSTGRDTTGALVGDDDSVTADQLWSTASVAKTQSRTTYHTGDQITYGVTVTTDGNTTQRITLTDAVCPVEHATLQDADDDVAGFQFDTTVADTSYSFTCSLTAGNFPSITNTVTLTSDGRNKLGSTYTNTATVTAAQLWTTATVAKSQDRSTYHTGDQINYGVTVTTDGNTTQRITLVDPVCPVQHATLSDADNGTAGFQFDTSVAVKSYAFTCSLTAPNQSSITNAVTLTSTGRDLTGSTYTDTASVTADQVWTTASVDKTQSLSTYHTGDTISYDVTVTTAGNTTQRITLRDAVCPVQHATLQDADTNAAGFQFDTTAAVTSYAFTCSLMATNVPSITNEVLLSSSGRDTTGNTYTDSAAVTAAQRWSTASVTKQEKLSSAASYQDGPISVVPTSTIDYRVTVSTDGNEAQTVTLTDDLCTLASADPTLVDADMAAAGFQIAAPIGSSSYVFTCSVDVAGGTADIENIATVTSTGIDKSGARTGGSDSVLAHVHDARLSIDKTQRVAGSGAAFDDTITTAVYAGTAIEYQVAVTNDGNVALDITTLDAGCDSATPLTLVSGTETSLAPGATATYTCERVTTVADAGTAGGLAENTAEATGVDADGHAAPKVTDTASKRVLVTVITMSKTVFDAETGQWEATNRAHVGDTIRYEITVANAGNNTLDFELVDAKCTLGTLTSESVDAGDTATYTCEHVVTDADGDVYVNTATIDGTDEGGRQVDATASASTTILKPDFTVTKQVRVAGSGAAFAASTSAHVGDTLEYQIVVTNTGNTQLTFDLADPACGALASTAPAGHDGVDDVIDRGGAVTSTCTHVVGAFDPNPYVNVVRAIGTDGLGLDTAKDARADATILVPALVVDKQVRNATAGRDYADSGRGMVGDRIEFRHTVTNSGNVALTVNVSDDRCEGLAGPAGFDGAGDVLTAGQTVQYTCFHVLTATDPNPFVNVVRVSGVDAIGGTVAATDGASVQIESAPVEAGGPPPRPVASSRLTPPSGCQRGPFRVLVTGTNIRQVRFYVDGRLRSVVRRGVRNRWVGRLTTRGLRAGTRHRLMVRVYYTPATGRRPQVRAARFGVCRPPVVMPAFTG